MNINWSKLILRCSAASGKQVATIAREIKSDAEHLRRLAREEVQEPKWSTAIKLLDYYHDLFDGDMGAVKNGE